MKILRTPVKSFFVDFKRLCTICVNDRFLAVIGTGKIVAKAQRNDGLLISFQDSINLMFHQDKSIFDGKLLDDTFNRVAFYSFKDIKEAKKVALFEPKKINAFIYLAEDFGFCRLCSFNPSDFDETTEIQTKIGKRQKKRVVVLDCVTAIPEWEEEPPTYYLVGTEMETSRGIECFWELWKNDELAYCDKIVFADLFYHKSLGDDCKICDNLFDA